MQRANLYSLTTKEWMISLSPVEEKTKTHHSGGIAIDKNNLYTPDLKEFFHNLKVQ